MNKKDLEIAIIGAGKFAHSFVPQLVKERFLVKIIVDENLESCKNLAGICGINQFSTKIKDIPESCNLLFFSVPDDKIKFAAKQALKEGKFKPNTIFCHFSGAKTSEEFAVPNKSEIIPASLHILQTFPNFTPRKLKGCFAAIETENDMAKSALQLICKHLKLNFFEINKDDKAVYHLLGVFGSNFIVANFAAAKSLSRLTSTQLPPVNVLLKQIAHQTLTNICTAGIENSLSGPVERADVGTIERHLSTLQNAEIEEQLLYLSASLQALKTALQKHPENKSKYFKIKNLLVEELKNLVDSKF